jgi:hypothetical protein
MVSSPTARFVASLYLKVGLADVNRAPAVHHHTRVSTHHAATTNPSVGRASNVEIGEKACVGYLQGQTISLQRAEKAWGHIGLVCV